jgi:hypothetical protein
MGRKKNAPADQAGAKTETPVKGTIMTSISPVPPVDEALAADLTEWELETMRGRATDCGIPNCDRIGHGWLEEIEQWSHRVREVHENDVTLDFMAEPGGVRVYVLVNTELDGLDAGGLHALANKMHAQADTVRAAADELERSAREIRRPSDATAHLADLDG